MKKTINLICILSLAFFINCSEDTTDYIGEGTITGRVVEADSFDPIENAKITISPTGNTVFTDLEGYFIMANIEEGEYSVSATKEEYLTSFEAATVIEDSEVNVIFELQDNNTLNKPPSAPQLITPEDGSEDLELSVELVWSSEDPDEDDLSYRLEIKNDIDNNTILIESLIDTTYVISNLKYGVKYFWQVAVSDAINEDVLSVVNTFKTKYNPDNRYFYVKKSDNNNNIIYSSNFDEDNGEQINEVQLTSEDKNSWRPRKNQAANLIAFLRTEDNETHLFTMKQNGSDIQQVTSEIAVAGYNFNNIDYSWSSNGDRLIYPHYDKLYVINKDGSGLQQIYQTLDGSFITECDWSNDESMIALKTNDILGYNASIYTIDMEGAVISTVISDVLGALGGLNISVDNKLLLYTLDVSEYQNANNRQLDTHIFIYNFSEATTVDISSDKDSGTIDLDPRFSPNEAEIIFVNTSNDGISTKSIYKMSIDVESDSDRVKLFENALMPDWE
ncbi:carboxypeptidase regulatory-like domain-containing protein [Lutibacter sp. A80]|uniref:carboxypeptidase regulatory-like domain-containing protein n=1 Tax=Lutibacter sp. A80 TaxID=2918453 RepID=UPI001F06E1A6|nr:carboxypeptidase regulatory-like domain-containing protein [Lutibacter sp. A80]UMB61865.1 carboxypeptidase regulatory-like domain-containing protein [Lutibacter sp. A80]